MNYQRFHEFFNLTIKDFTSFPIQLSNISQVFLHTTYLGSDIDALFSKLFHEFFLHNMSGHN